MKLRKELIPNKVLLALVNKIEDEACEAVREGEDECGFELDMDGWYIDGTATLCTRTVDTSFSHEFGTCESYRLEFVAIEAIDVETSVFIVPDIDGSADELDADFDYKRFYEVCKSRNIDKGYDERAERMICEYVQEVILEAV